MKLVIEPIKKMDTYKDIDGLILSLKDYSVQSINYYDVDEIRTIRENNKDIEIFVSVNKTMLNSEIDSLKETLIELDKLDINGIFFYDLCLIELKKKLNLKTDLIWSQTHMVNNYKTCNYYNSLGVKYALLGKEITLEEIKEIVSTSTITSMVEVVGLPSVAFSRRKLITNFYADLNKESKSEIDVVEKITNKTYNLIEDNNGTSFFLKELVNGTSIIKDLYEVNCPYIIMREYGMDSNEFYELVSDTKKYIEGNCLDEEYVNKYTKLGNFTNFFFKKTIYKVKKNG